MAKEQLPHAAPRWKRDARTRREIEFDSTLRALRDGPDRTIDQIFNEYKVIDSKTQSLLTFIGLLGVVYSASTNQLQGDVFAELGIWLALAFIAIASLFALSCINLIGGHTAKLKVLFNTQFESEEARIYDAQTILARIAVDRRSRYLSAFTLTFMSIAVFVSAASYSYIKHSIFL